MNISILQICLISLFYCFSNISWPFGSMGQWATINRPLVGGLVVGLILCFVVSDLLVCGMRSG